MSCNPNEHKYVYQGTLYLYETYPVPGSGARGRYYFDRYYCEKCLDTQDRNRRDIGNSYTQPLPGTLPA